MCLLSFPSPSSLSHRPASSTCKIALQEGAEQDGTRGRSFILVVLLGFCSISRVLAQHPRMEPNRAAPGSRQPEMLGLEESPLDGGTAQGERCDTGAGIPACKIPWSAEMRSGRVRWNKSHSAQSPAQRGCHGRCCCAAGCALTVAGAGEGICRKETHTAPAEER